MSILYFGLCALFVGKGLIPPSWQWIAASFIGLPFSWWSLRPLGSGSQEGAEGFAIRVIRENGKPCLLREKGVTYKGCYYQDVGGCAIPQEGLRGNCPTQYDEFRRRYGGDGEAPRGGSDPEECSGDSWMKIVALRDDQIDDLVRKGKHPLAACLKRRGEMVQTMRQRFLDDLKSSENTQDLCSQVRKGEIKASNKIARELFREVYRECFSDAEPAESAKGIIGNDHVPRVRTSGYVLMDEPELLTIDKDGRESDDVLRRHMRQEFVSKCSRFVSQKTPEQVQAFIELGEKVETLEWWKNVSMMVERTADEIRKAQLLSTTHRIGVVA